MRVCVRVGVGVFIVNCVLVFFWGGLPSPTRDYSKRVWVGGGRGGGGHGREGKPADPAVQTKHH